MIKDVIEKGTFWRVQVGKKGFYQLIPTRYAANLDEVKLFLDDDMTPGRRPRTVSGWAYRLDITQNYMGPYRTKNAATRRLEAARSKHDTRP